MSPSDELPPELEDRLATLERLGTRDFGRAELAWMLLLGGVVPVILIVFGWFA